MKIVEASLCLRFYTSHGWTRAAVARLLREDRREARVMPQYFDERDQCGQGKWELDDGLPHDECDYFAVYDKCDPFSPELIKEHM